MYSAKIDGEATTFGTSGFLYRSNKIMYDRKTDTLWSSLTGVPVIGELARRDDLRLDYFPVSLTTWAEWLEERPHTKVLSNETGYYSPSRDTKPSRTRAPSTTPTAPTRTPCSPCGIETRALPPRTKFSA